MTRPQVSRRIGEDVTLALRCAGSPAGSRGPVRHVTWVSM